MAISHMQKMHIAKLGNVIQAVGRGGRIGIRVSAHAQAGHGARAQDLHKFACGEIHGVLKGWQLLKQPLIFKSLKKPGPAGFQG